MGQGALPDQQHVVRACPLPACSGAPGRLLLSSPPPHRGSSLPAPLWPPVPPFAPGLQRLRERLGPARSSSSHCLLLCPRGEASAMVWDSTPLPPPPHPLSSSHTASGGFSTRRRHAPASGPLHRCFRHHNDSSPGAYKPCPRLFRPVFECHLLEFQAFPD